MKLRKAVFTLLLLSIIMGLAIAGISAAITAYTLHTSPGIETDVTIWGATNSGFSFGVPIGAFMAIVSILKQSREKKSARTDGETAL